MSEATITEEPVTVSERMALLVYLKNEAAALAGIAGNHNVSAANLIDQVERMGACVVLKNEAAEEGGRRGSGVRPSPEVRGSWFGRVWSYIRGKAADAVAWVRRVGPLRALTETTNIINLTTTGLSMLGKSFMGLVGVLRLV